MSIHSEIDQVKTEIDARINHVKTEINVWNDQNKSIAIVMNTFFSTAKRFLLKVDKTLGKDFWNIIRQQVRILFVSAYKEEERIKGVLT